MAFYFGLMDRRVMGWSFERLARNIHVEILRLPLISRLQSQLTGTQSFTGQIQGYDEKVPEISIT